MNESNRSRHLRRRLSGTVVVIAVCAVAAKALGQTPASATVWDGVYTEAQAKQGEGAFVAHCAECHGQDLEGREQAPALAGLSFLDKWNKATVRKFLETVEQMPPDEPKSLAAQQYVDVVAYLLSANGFPSGQAALTGDRAALGRIEMRNVRPTK